MSELALIIGALVLIIGSLVGYFIVGPWIDSRKR